MPSSSASRPPACRKSCAPKAILIGIVAATVLRIGFASVTAQLLQIIGLLLAGGVLLLVGVLEDVARVAGAGSPGRHGRRRLDGVHINPDGTAVMMAPRKTFGQATWQIVVADVSMSLDNVLAVAGAAREHPYILIFGLVLSIALMGVAANFIANLLQRHRWIAYVGLAIILYVALEMVYRGWWKCGRSRAPSRSPCWADHVWPPVQRSS